MGTIRASQAKTNVANLMGLGEAGRRVLAKVQLSTLDEIDRASRLDWVPIELDIELNECVDRVLGRHALERWSHDTLSSSMAGPLLGPLVNGAIRLFGLDPRSILKLAPRAYTNLFRDCGTLTWFNDHPTKAELRLTDAPLVLVASDAYLAGIAASFEAVFTITQTKGTVSARRRGPHEVSFEIECPPR
jgi:hypothetical protein